MTARLGVAAPSVDVLRSSVASGVSLGSSVSAHGPAGASIGQLLQLGRAVHAELRGICAPIAGLLEDASVTDVLVNGPSDVWVDRGAGLVRASGVGFRDEADVRGVAVRMAAACGRRLDDSTPIVDGSLDVGLRLHAVLPPLAPCATISLRVLRTRAFSVEQLVQQGTVAVGIEAVVRGLVSGRASCLISGATGTGKTTLLAALLGLVDADERIVCIEEVSELWPAHPHVVHLQERRENVQGVGAVSMSELLRAAMRMRPDRIVLGECRGPEVREVLSAMNTGHQGGWATLHANSVFDVPARLVALGALAGMGPEVVAAQAASAVQALVHIRRRKTGEGGALAAAGASAGAGAGAARTGERTGPGSLVAVNSDARRVLPTRWVAQIGTLENDRGHLKAALGIEIEPDGTLRQGPAWTQLQKYLEHLDTDHLERLG
ncbi:MAG: TadA family conjugal transfer-associated ATPase [Actinomycetaceae bacterium]|nr:TadA family conjugal transfer-associated ATPase [Actinomycetaceae bacterium]